MNKKSDDRLVDRAIWRIMPFVTLSFVAATIDKSNIGFAKLQMVHSLRLTEATFAFGSSLFFLAYILCEIPSALAAHRVGSSRWIVRIIASWSVATVLLAFTNSVLIFYALRLLLGAAEAGLYPTLLFYMTLWFPQKHQARVAGFLTLGSAIGNGCGALISGPLLDLNGVFGLDGWQWIFLATGALSLVVAAFVMRFMPDSPSEAKFLTKDENVRLMAMVNADKPVTPDERHVLAVLFDLRVLGLSIVYMVIGVALFGVIYWMPTVIHSFGVTGTVNGILSGAPWAVTGIALITIPAKLRTRGGLLWAMAAIGLCGALCFAATAVFDETALRYAGMLVGTPCILVSIALFWTFPVRLFNGAKAAATIAAINVMGNIGGFFAQNLMPAVAQIEGHAAFAMWVPSVCLIFVGIGATVAGARQRARKEELNCIGQT